MLCGGDPVLDDLLEFGRRHARVRDHEDFEYRMFAPGERAFNIALEQRGEWFLRFPLGMLRRERLHAVEREEQLEIHRLLAPERAVVIERGDALRLAARSPASLPSVTFATKPRSLSSARCRSRTARDPQPTRSPPRRCMQTPWQSMNTLRKDFADHDVASFCSMPLSR